MASTLTGRRFKPLSSAFERELLIRKLLTTDPTALDHLSARFGRRNAKRSEQIEGVLETLRGLGQV